MGRRADRPHTTRSGSRGKQVRVCDHRQRVILQPWYTTGGHAVNRKRVAVSSPICTLR